MSDESALRLYVATVEYHGPEEKGRIVYGMDGEIAFYRPDGDEGVAA